MFCCVFFYCFNFLCISKQNKRWVRKNKWTELRHSETESLWSGTRRISVVFFFILFYILSLFSSTSFVCTRMCGCFVLFYMCSRLIFPLNMRRCYRCIKYSGERTHTANCTTERIVCAQNYKHSSLGNKKKINNDDMCKVLIHIKKATSTRTEQHIRRRVHTPNPVGCWNDNEKSERI